MKLATLFLTLMAFASSAPAQELAWPQEVLHDGGGIVSQPLNPFFQLGGEPKMRRCLKTAYAIQWFRRSQFLTQQDTHNGRVRLEKAYEARGRLGTWVRQRVPIPLERFMNWRTSAQLSRRNA